MANPSTPFHLVHQWFDDMANFFFHLRRDIGEWIGFKSTADDRFPPYFRVFIVDWWRVVFDLQFWKWGISFIRYCFDYQGTEQRSILLREMTSYSQNLTLEVLSYPCLYIYQYTYIFLHLSSLHTTKETPHTFFFFFIL